MKLKIIKKHQRLVQAHLLRQTSSANKQRKVSSNIRLCHKSGSVLKVFFGALFGSLFTYVIATTAYAQTSVDKDANAAEQASALPPILRLEDTIRANTEQPQVLTIVPWQLPVHQRVNENSDWQLQVKSLSSIERNAFLRNLAVLQEVKTTPAAASQAMQEKKATTPKTQ